MIVTLLLVLSLISTPIATPVTTLRDPDLMVVLPANAVTRPFLRDGRVYVGLDAREMVAIDLASGDTMWTLPLMATTSDEPEMAGDTLLVPGADGALYLVDAASGQLIDTVILGTSQLWTPVVTESDIVVVSHDGVAYILDPEDLHQISSRVLGTSVGVRPVVMENLLITVTDGDVVTAVNLDTQEIAWQSVMAGGVTRLFATPEGRLIIGQSDGLVSMLDRDGQVQWQEVFQTDDIIDLTYANGNVLLAQTGGFLASFNVESGEVVWQVAVEGNAQFTDERCGGTCFIAMSNGTLGTVDAESGTVTMTYVLPAGLATRPRSDDVALVVSASNGLLLIWHRQ